MPYVPRHAAGTPAGGQFAPNEKIPADIGELDLSSGPTTGIGQSGPIQMPQQPNAGDGQARMHVAPLPRPTAGPVATVPAETSRAEVRTLGARRKHAARIISKMEGRRRTDDTALAESLLAEHAEARAALASIDAEIDGALTCAAEAAVRLRRSAGGDGANVAVKHVDRDLRRLVGDDVVAAALARAATDLARA